MAMPRAEVRNDSLKTIPSVRVLVFTHNKISSAIAIKKMNKNHPDCQIEKYSEQYNYTTSGDEGFKVLLKWLNAQLKQAKESNQRVIISCEFNCCFSGQNRCIVPDLIKQVEQQGMTLIISQLFGTGNGNENLAEKRKQCSSVCCNNECYQKYLQHSSLTEVKKVNKENNQDSSGRRTRELKDVRPPSLSLFGDGIFIEKNINIVLPSADSVAKAKQRRLSRNIRTQHDFSFLKVMTQSHIRSTSDGNVMHGMVITPPRNNSGSRSPLTPKNTGSK